MYVSVGSCMCPVSFVLVVYLEARDERGGGGLADAGGAREEGGLGLCCFGRMVGWGLLAMRAGGGRRMHHIDICIIYTYLSIHLYIRTLKQNQYIG